MKPEAIKRLLPDVVQRACHEKSPLHTLIEIMSALHEPTERIRRELFAVFDPRRTPDRFVPYLARWVDLPRLLDGSEHRGAGAAPSAAPSTTRIELGQLRELIASAVEISQWRGTTRGMVLFLETATGVPGFEIEEAVVPPGESQPRPFHIRVRIPTAAAEQRVVIENIIQREKPAYVTAEWVVAGEDEGRD